MRRHLAPVLVLLASFAVLCLGHGLQSVLLPARAIIEEYSNLTIGLLMSSYFAGFIAGTFTSPPLIARVGHIRVFAAASACACAIMLCHPLMLHPLAWVVLRTLYGFCLVHLYTVMESWLNSIGETANRGRILSVYMIVNFISVSMGQLLFFAGPAKGYELFSISAMLLALSLVPLILSRSVQPAAIPAPERFGLKRLYTVSPLGVMGALIAGLMGGAYGGLAAAYIIRMGFSENFAALFMAVSLLGGLLGQWPLGALSDRIDRRYVVVLASILVCLSAASITLMVWQAHPERMAALWLIVAAASFGVGFHPLYSLCVAHVNDFVPPEQFVRASAGLQMVQGIGAVAGPLLAGGLMQVAGGNVLFLTIAVLAAILTLYTLLRLRTGRVPPHEHGAPFQPLDARTGLLAIILDPRYKARRQR
jgi:MFS family permease